MKTFVHEEETNIIRFFRKINGNNICEEKFCITYIHSALEYSFRSTLAAAVGSLL